MPLIEWNDNLSVGVSSFDMQHKQLVAMLNELYDAMKGGKGNDVLGPILSQLNGYVLTHFANEEKRMAEFAYPGMAAHKKEHEALIAQLKEFKDKFTAGKAGLSITLMNFLKDWLVKHIKGTDMQYREFFNAKGVK